MYLSVLKAKKFSFSCDLYVILGAFYHECCYYHKLAPDKQKAKGGLTITIALS